MVQAILSLKSKKQQLTEATTSCHNNRDLSRQSRGQNLLYNKSTLAAEVNRELNSTTEKCTVELELTKCIKSLSEACIQL